MIRIFGTRFVAAYGGRSWIIQLSFGSGGDGVTAAELALTQRGSR